MPRLQEHRSDVVQELGVEKRGEGLLVEKDEGLVVLQQGHVIAQDADADLGDLLG